MKADGLQRLFNQPNEAAQGSQGTLNQSEDDSYRDPQGMFIRYRYEVDSTFGVLGSASYALQDGRATFNSDYGQITSRTESNYASAMFGPSFRLTDYLSFYGLAGLAYKSITRRYTQQNAGGFGYNTTSEDKVDFAYSIGAQINVYKQFVADAAYEESTGSGEWNAKGFTIGIGYKF